MCKNKSEKKDRQVINVNNMSPSSSAYIAGFADGDGSFVAQAVYKPDYVLKWQIRTSFLLIQKNSRIDALYTIKDEIGMGVIRSTKGKEQVAEYSLVGSPALKLFLPQIIPYLRIKKAQASLMLELIEKSEQVKANNNDKALFFEALDIMDHIASLNDSKMIKRTNTGAFVKAKTP